MLPSFGLVIKVNSDTFTVKIDNDIIDCKSRGKIRNDKIKPLVGDQVLVNKENMTIEKIMPRRNVLDRPPVSNIDIALIVTSIKEPNLNLTLLDKLISIITINHIEPVVVFTKWDLASKSEIKDVKNLSKYYQKIGIKCFKNNNIFSLKRYLKHKIVVVCGQTGAGKSSLINKMDHHLNLKTDAISEALGRGKHTTRIVELFAVGNFYIVDTPGFSSILINKYSEEEIRNSFIEFSRINCKFNNCNHLNENGCKVLDLVKKGQISESRYQNYVRFIKE